MVCVPFLACIQSLLPSQTDPFFFRYSRKKECIPALNQIPSYLPLEVERDHRGQLSQLSGSAGRHTDRVNPHGSRLVIGLTGNRVNDCPALSLLWSGDRIHRQNMQGGSATFIGLFHIILDMDTNESPREQEVWT